MDACEQMIADALSSCGFEYLTDFGGGNPSGLDFCLTGTVAAGLEIEVKRFHSPRIADQMARAENVIAIQGTKAVAFFAHILDIYSRAQRIALLERERRNEPSRPDRELPREAGRAPGMG